MDNFKKFRYDFFGDLSVDVMDESDNNEIDQNQAKKLQVPSAHKGLSVVEDSLMEFITEYFKEEHGDDFSSSEYFYPCDEEEKSHDSTQLNTSAELCTSPENSLMNTSCSEPNDSTNASTDSTVSATPKRRKSISYEIRFMNSKGSDGRVKLEIVPSRKTIGQDGRNYQAKDYNEKIQNENTWLRERVHNLEIKLKCVEQESERVVSELTRILERKNEQISQLELEIAGVKFTHGVN